VIFGSSEGVLKAVDKFTGKLIWSYTTDNQIAGSATFGYQVIGQVLL